MPPGQHRAQWSMWKELEEGIKDRKACSLGSPLIPRAARVYNSSWRVPFALISGSRRWSYMVLLEQLNVLQRSFKENLNTESFRTEDRPGPRAQPTLHSASACRSVFGGVLGLESAKLYYCLPTLFNAVSDPRAAASTNLDTATNTSPEQVSLALPGQHFRRTLRGDQRFR
ncbi:hypothetical protein BDZ89DRAFT_1051474 [Hymenopellis radicata]|nr:hypothetical protein BDZ89DRAFT_1051474 [Hymenopellis radicata]